MCGIFDKIFYMILESNTICAIATAQGKGAIAVIRVSGMQTKEIVAKIDGTEWFFSNKHFVDFTKQLERNAKWIYSGESELMLLPLINGEIVFDKILVFYLDDMLRDNAIKSIPSFIQQLSRLFESKSTLNEIHMSLAKDNAIELIKKIIISKLPQGICECITKGKYFIIAK